MSRVYTPEQRARKDETNRQWTENNRDKVNKRSKDWAQRHPEQRKQIKKNWDKVNPKWQTENRKKKFASALLYVARNRSKKSGKPFDLTKEWITKRLEPMKCEVTHIQLVITQKGKSFQGPWTPSLDQIKPGRGYTKRNTQIVCWAYNAAKQKWDLKIVKDMARALLMKEGEL